MAIAKITGKFGLFFLPALFILFILWSLEDETKSSLRREYTPDNETLRKQKYPERSIVRRILTRSSYPLSLTAPYNIENPDICSSANVTILFSVQTATGNFDKRLGVRETFGNKDLFKTVGIRVVFLLGRSANNKTEKKIQEENSKYGDIVQGEFVDSFQNLTLKGVMGLRWVTAHCSHAKMVMKVGDDFHIDVFKVLEDYLPRFANNSLQMVCSVNHRHKVERKGKWEVHSDYFKGFIYYLPYCSGFIIMMTPDVVKILYRSAFFTPFFWVSDVYLFGLLPSKYGNITRTTLTEHVHFHVWTIEECLVSYRSAQPIQIVACWTDERRRGMFWERTLLNLSNSTLEMVKDDIRTMIDSIKNKNISGTRPKLL